jgi:hypothetical protein
MTDPWRGEGLRPYLRRRQATWPASRVFPAPPKVGHITSWIRRRPDNLDDGE